MTDRFDEAKRALGEVPAPDLWDEAERRAEATSVVGLEAAGARFRRPARWLAAAAAAVVAVGAIGLAAQDEKQEVEAGPAGEGALVPLVPPAADFPASDGRCGFALAGNEPYSVVHDAVSPWFSSDGQPAQQQVVTLELGTQQTAEVAVPGVVLIDLVGERVEDVELQRGTAQVWFSSEFVQVRWFTGSRAPCESFTVTVWGSSEDGNRHAAVDLAEHVLLPAELDAAVERSLEGEWQMKDARLGGQPIDPGEVTFSFRDRQVRWDDGCNQADGTFEIASATSIRVDEVNIPDFACPNDATVANIARVMASLFAVTTTADALMLRAEGSEGLTYVELRPIEDSPDVEDPAGDLLAGTEWRLDSTQIEGASTDGNGAIFSFADGRASWSDGCNSFGADYGFAGENAGELGGQSVLELGDISSTELACPTNPTSEAITAVMSSGQVMVTFGSGRDVLLLQAGGRVLELVLIDGATDSEVIPVRNAADPYAIWPMTAPESVLGYEAEFTGSPTVMAVTFAREVLGWSDAAVSSAEQKGDGGGGFRLRVRSKSNSGVIEVWVRPGEPRAVNVVYSVDVPGLLDDPEAGAGLSSVGATASAHLTPVPQGTATSTVIFTYGEYTFEGPMGEDIDMSDRPESVAGEVPGAVLVLFRDSGGNVIGAWGRALPAGDFAAS